jgi:ABC-type nickel/cobalt efflux system permease component RcnA
MDTFLKSVIAGQLRHVLTVAAGSLVTAGALDASQSESFVAIGSGLVLWLGTAAWSYFQKVRTVG